MSLRDDFVVARRATPLLGRIKYRSNIVSQDESQFLLQIRVASSAFGPQAVMLQIGSISSQAVVGLAAAARGARINTRSCCSSASITACSFPLHCPPCGTAMRIIAFITDRAAVRDILAHLGEPTTPPAVAPARGPPLWQAVSAEHEPTPDPVLPPIPAYEIDQRIAW